MSLYDKLLELNSKVFELEERLKRLEATNGLQPPEVIRDYDHRTGELVATRVQFADGECEVR